MKIIVAVALSSSSLKIQFHALVFTFCGLHPGVFSCFFCHLHTVVYGQLYLADTSFGRKPLARSSPLAQCALSTSCVIPKARTRFFWGGSCTNPNKTLKLNGMAPDYRFYLNFDTNRKKNLRKMVLGLSLPTFWQRIHFARDQGNFLIRIFRACNIWQIIMKSSYCFRFLWPNLCRFNEGFMQYHILTLIPVGDMK